MGEGSEAREMGQGVVRLVVPLTKLVTLVRRPLSSRKPTLPTGSDPSVSGVSRSLSFRPRHYVYWAGGRHSLTVTRGKVHVPVNFIRRETFSGTKNVESLINLYNYVYLRTERY